MLGRNLIYLPCRHHIQEILLRSVFETCWPGTVVPNVAIFKQFQVKWMEIDTREYETGLSDEIIRTVVNEKNDIKNFISEQLEIRHPRGDYGEFLGLSYIFLDGVPPRGVEFTAPGAIHHVRWLVKAIYSLKAFIFREQLILKKDQIEETRQVCPFIILFYVKSWLTCPFAIEASRLDLASLRDLIQYRNINATVANAVLKKFSGHLWYITEELIALALFGFKVSKDEKIKLPQALKQRSSEGKYLKRITIECPNIVSLQGKVLSDSATNHSIFCLSNLGLHRLSWKNIRKIGRSIKIIKKDWKYSRI
uniref:Uncharacterized protein n=1 Tax=Bracon brevicornis TaxID=1563983 RepID=A0A6V7II93_9HYME